MAALAAYAILQVITSANWCQPVLNSANKAVIHPGTRLPWQDGRRVQPGDGHLDAARRGGGEADRGLQEDAAHLHVRSVRV